MEFLGHDPTGCTSVPTAGTPAGTLTDSITAAHEGMLSQGSVNPCGTPVRGAGSRHESCRCSGDAAEQVLESLRGGAGGGETPGPGKEHKRTGVEEKDRERSATNDWQGKATARAWRQLKHNYNVYYYIFII